MEMPGESTRKSLYLCENVDFKYNLKYKIVLLNKLLESIVPRPFIDMQSLHKVISKGGLLQT